MKLIDKIQEARSNKLSDYSKIYTPTAEVIEGIVDEFAIDFAEWVEKLRNSHLDSLDFHLYLDNDTKQLLQIFKEEKEL